MKFLIVIASVIAFASAIEMQSKLEMGNCMTKQDTLSSDGNCFKMNVKGCGDLVIRRKSDDKVVWAAGASGQGGHKACMQGENFF